MVDEINQFARQGIQFEENRMTVSVHSLICDAPAKSMSLITKYFNGYNICPKCTLEGDYINGRLYFPILSFEKRRDDSLSKCINTFWTYWISVSLEMCLSIICTLFWLQLWKKRFLCGNLAQRREVKFFREFCTKWMLKNFQRLLTSWICSLRETWIESWAASISVNAGPVILRAISKSTDPVYINFLTMHCATRLLCSPKNRDAILYAIFIAHRWRCYESGTTWFNQRVQVW